MALRVDSEIGRLRRVLVHRPGLEIDRMVPTMMAELLFDDILDGDAARREHQVFRRVLRRAGVEVLTAGDLLSRGARGRRRRAARRSTASNGCRCRPRSATGWSTCRRRSWRRR